MQCRKSASVSSLAAAGGAAGIAAPILMWTAFLVAAPRRPGYDLLRDSSSALGEIGSAGASIFNLAFFLVPGLLIIGFAAALATLPGRLWMRLVASIFIGLSGLSVLMSGLIPMAPDSEPLSFWHRFAGLPLLTLLPAGILLTSVALAWQMKWRPCGRLGLVCGAVLVLLNACYTVHIVEIPDGLFQRTSLAILTFWFVAIGQRLLRRRWPEREGARA